MGNKQELAGQKSNGNKTVCPQLIQKMVEWNFRSVN